MACKKRYKDYWCVVFKILGWTLHIYPAKRFISKIVKNSCIKHFTLLLDFLKTVIHVLGIAWSKCSNDTLGSIFLSLCLFVPVRWLHLQPCSLHTVGKNGSYHFKNGNAFTWFLISTSTWKQAPLSPSFRLSHWTRALIFPACSHANFGVGK